jgi:hypothetical protein
MARGLREGGASGCRRFVSIGTKLTEVRRRQPRADGECRRPAAWAAFNGSADRVGVELEERIAAAGTLDHGQRFFFAGVAGFDAGFFGAFVLSGFALTVVAVLSTAPRSTPSSFFT